MPAKGPSGFIREVDMTYRASVADSGNYPKAATAWYGLICLLLCYFMFYVDRNILTLLVAPVRRDLAINDTQMGILQGISFSLFYGVMGIPFGWAADRLSRRNLLIFGIAIWGCCTIASGFTTTFTQLVITRMGLGLGEAALLPAAYSLISDYFPKERRGRAVGAFGIGGFGGIGLSYIIGGAVLASFRGVDTVALPLVGETSLWHAAFIVVGLGTLVLALLVSTVREAPRLAEVTETRGGEARVTFLQHLRKHWVSFCVVVGAYCCVGIVAIGWFAWLPSYFIREFKMAPPVVGFEVGWVTTISGVLGAVAGGYIADYFTRRGFKGGKMPTLVILFLCWIPAALGIWLFDNPTVSLCCVFLFTFADGIGLQQYANVVQEMFPAHLRARSIAAWIVCMNFLAYGTGPLIYGLATDFVFHGDTGLRYALGIVSLPVIALGLGLSWFGRKAYDRSRHAVDPTVRIDPEWIGADLAYQAKV